MTPKAKKKNTRRKKQYRRPKNNENVDGADVTEDRQLVPYKPSNVKTGEKIHKPSQLINKKQSLSLIELAANKLQKEDNVVFLEVLEKIFQVFKADPDKRQTRLELITKIVSIASNSSTKQLNRFKPQLNGVFLPKELKELVIDPGDLTMTLNLLDFMMLCHFGGTEDRLFMEGNLSKGRHVKVLVKVPRSETHKVSIVEEAKTLSKLRHDNIVRLVAFDKTGPRFAVEYMKLGTLSKCLEDISFSATKLVNVLKDITAAMVYVAEKKLVMRNLNSENVLVDARGKCKLGNFEYCRYVGDTNGVYVEKHGDLDVDFAAPEVRKSHEFSTKSDVWDLGLLAWEIYSAMPGQGIIPLIGSAVRRYYNFEVFIESGELQKPRRFPVVLWAHFKMMVLNNDPSIRPTFVDVMKMLEKFPQT
ncbi:hypothetical protein NQ315_007458 [Exocentrus adspersus]|uniref:Protein kinase domain-containing protein n=1 Tax=Exocentrus adspersus TaxID=1586481 RepID=A0AAV8VHF5_9CUCU|nr:hypothetical protein NQ315_007458 [Exocentrus adspersus]